MKHIIIILSSVFISSSFYSQVNNEKTQNQGTGIVINHAMIEKFNNHNYPSDKLNFYKVINRYGFTDAKLIIAGYKNDKLKILSKEVINSFLSDVHLKVAPRANRIFLLIEN